MVTIWGSPFGTTDAATAGVVQAIAPASRRTTGTSGPGSSATSSTTGVVDPRARVSDIRDDYTAKAAGNAAAGRMAATSRCWS
ncbi:MAG: hypothetical protein WKF75_17580 [Singulisphaera sp.]